MLDNLEISCHRAISGSYDFKLQIMYLQCQKDEEEELPIESTMTEPNKPQSSGVFLKLACAVIHPQLLLLPGAR